MITHFVHVEGHVGFVGRYYDPTTNRWLPLLDPGVVDSAEYQGRANLQVVSLSEVGTVPTWTLQDAAVAAAKPPRFVTGEDLLDLTLHLRFTLPDGAQRSAGVVEGSGNGAHGVMESYVLEFTRAALDAQSRQPLHTYELRWRDPAAGIASVPYCVDARGEADPVVFQGGIAVDPDTARVTRDATTEQVVTLSCRGGAPATVYSWGYRHREDAFYFDAALQMKRASYCGDGVAYTRSPTPIQVADDRPALPSPLARLEARWTPRGASCVNRDHLRHPEIAAEKQFTFACQGQPLPPCASAEPGPYLASGVVTLGR